MKDKKSFEKLVIDLCGACLMLGFSATAAFATILWACVFAVGYHNWPASVLCFVFAIILATVARWMLQSMGEKMARVRFWLSHTIQFMTEEEQAECDRRNGEGE